MGFAGLCLLTTACGPWQRIGVDVPPDAGQFVPPLFDAGTVYREMGLLVGPAPLPFVGSVRFLAGATPDTTLAVIGLTMSRNALSFRRAGDAFEARYRAEVRLHRHGIVVAHTSQEQLVRVTTLAESQRGDASIVFQQITPVPPDSLQISLIVHDLNAGSLSQADGVIVAPVFGPGPQLSSIIPVYRARPRSDRSTNPDLAVNPKGVTAYGVDTLQLYLELYGDSGEHPVLLRGISPEAHRTEAWRDTVFFGAGGLVRSAVVVVEPDKLALGQLLLEASIVGSDDTVRSVTLVTFSSEWVVANFDETLSLLRYFPADEALRRLREAPVEERPAHWRAFWTATDPDPTTPGNEAIELYFQRMQEANERFAEAGQPGWLSDRGEVFLTFGAPDEIWDASSGLEPAGGLPYIRWTYISARLTLNFVDETGFGRFRLTERSRTDFLVVRARLRRSG